MSKGFIFDIKRFAVHDGPGIRTTLFFKGCPLSCWWCHNPESRNRRPQRSVRHLSLEGKVFAKDEVTGYQINVEELVRQVELDRIYYEESGGGVTLSGGEPLYQPEFCTDLLRALKEKGFHTVLDTTGYADSEDIRCTMPFTDLYLFDLKLMNDEEHLKYTMVSNKGILENLKLLKESGKQVIIRFPVIPGITDTFSNIRSIIEFLKQLHQCNAAPIEIHLLPYHTIAKNKYKRFRVDYLMDPEINLKAEKITSLKDQFIHEGFLVKIGG